MAKIPERDRPVKIDGLTISPDMLRAGAEVIALYWTDVVNRGHSSLYEEMVIEILKAVFQNTDASFRTPDISL